MTLLLCLGLFVQFLEGGDVQGRVTVDQPVALLKQFEAEHRKLLSRIGAYAVTFEEVHEGELPNNFTRVHLLREQKARSKDRWYKRTKFYYTAASSSPARIETDFLVVNSEYAIYYLEGNPAGYMWEHLSLDSLQKQAAVHLNLFTARDVMKHGFGDGFFTLSEILALHSDVRSEFRITLSNDKVYHVGVYDRENPQFPLRVYTIDGNKRYLFTDVAAYEDSGGVNVPVGKVEISLKEIDKGIWFPTNWINYSYGEPDAAGHRRVVKLIRSQLSSVEIGQEFDPRQFTWTALPMPNATLIHRTDHSGRTKVLKMEGNELVPMSLETP